MSRSILIKTIKKQIVDELVETNEAANVKKITINRSEKKIKIKLNNNKYFRVSYKIISEIINNNDSWRYRLKKAMKKELMKKSHKIYYVASTVDDMELDDLEGLENINVTNILPEINSIFFYATKEQLKDFLKINKNKVVCEMNDYVTIDPIEIPSKNDIDSGLNILSDSTQNLPEFLERIGASTSLARQVGFNYSKYAKDIYVFVLDTGISRHTLLNIDESRSKDFTNSEYGWFDVKGHGTHVSGSIAAKDRNIGVAPGVKVIAHKVLNDNGIGTLDSQLKSFEEIATFKDNNPNAKIVVNMSLGGKVSRDNIGPPFSTTKIYANTEKQISKLSNDYNIIFTLSAGNSTNDVSTARPSRVPEAITVGAYNSSDNIIAKFSNFGTLVDIMSPGVSINSTLPPLIPSTIPSTRTGFKNGTSMAAPLVTGSIVNMIAIQAMRNPDVILTPKQVKERLRNDAESSFNNNRNPKIDMSNTSISLCWSKSDSVFSEKECRDYWFRDLNGSPSVLKQTYPYSLFIGGYTKGNQTIQNY